MKVFLANPDEVNEIKKYSHFLFSYYDLSDLCPIKFRKKIFYQYLTKEKRNGDSKVKKK